MAWQAKGPAGCYIWSCRCGFHRRVQLSCTYFGSQTVRPRSFMHETEATHPKPALLQQLVACAGPKVSKCFPADAHALHKSALKSLLAMCSCLLGPLHASLPPWAPACVPRAQARVFCIPQPQAHPTAWYRIPERPAAIHLTRAWHCWPQFGSCCHGQPGQCYVAPSFPSPIAPAHPPTLAPHIRQQR